MYNECKAKQGRQTKTFEIRSRWDRSMARALRESRCDGTRIKKLQIVAFQTLQMKKQNIGKHSSMIGEHFETLCCKFEAWMPNSERGQNS